MFMCALYGTATVSGKKGRGKNGREKNFPFPPIVFFFFFVKYTFQNALKPKGIRGAEPTGPGLGAEGFEGRGAYPPEWKTL